MPFIHITSLPLKDSVDILQALACIDMMAAFIEASPELWNEGTGV
jgi:hypothetical protein